MEKEMVKKTVTLDEMIDEVSAHMGLAYFADSIGDNKTNFNEGEIIDSYNKMIKSLYKLGDDDMTELNDEEDKRGQEIYRRFRATGVSYMCLYCPKRGRTCEGYKNIKYIGYCPMKP